MGAFNAWHQLGLYSGCMKHVSHPQLLVLAKFGFCERLPQHYSALRLELATSHLQMHLMLKETIGVKGNTSFSSTRSMRNPLMVLLVFTMLLRSERLYGGAINADPYAAGLSFTY